MKALHENSFEIGNRGQRTLQLPGPVRREASVAAPQSELRYALDAIMRQRRFILVVGCASFALITVVLLLATPSYESSTRIVIDPPGAVAFSLESSQPGSGDPEYLQTQTKVLASDDLGLLVTREMHLESRIASLPKGVAARLAERIGVGSRPAPAVAKGQEISDDTHLTSAESAALSYLRAHLTIVPVKNSRVIEVGFKSADPELSANIPNTLVRRYIAESYAARYDAVMKSSEWLSKQLDDIHAKAEASAQALVDYQKANGIADVDDRQSTLAARDSELIRQFTSAQAERIQMQSYQLSLQRGNLDSLPQYRGNPVTQQLTAKLSELKAELSLNEVSYGPNHPVTLRLKSQIAEIEHQLDLQKKDAAAAVQAGYAEASGRERQLQAEMDGLTHQISQLSHYAILRREAQANQDLYDALYARVKEAGISAASKSSNIAVVDTARVPRQPSWPRLDVLLPLAFLSSWLMAVVLGIARDHWDRSIRSASDLPMLTGNQTPLLMVPRFPQKRLAENAPAKTNAILFGSQRASASRIDKFMLERVDSAEAESVRSLLGTVLAYRKKGVKVILFSSPSASEGKTTLAYNLAIALAGTARVCFVDADLRKSSELVEGVEGNPTLVDLYEGNVEASEIEVRSPDAAGLTVVQSGPAQSNPIPLLMSTAFQSLVSRLRADFEYIIVDSPPIVRFADARLLGLVSDGVILVARRGVTDRAMLNAATDIFCRLGIPVLGMVLNGVDKADVEQCRYYAGAQYA